MKSAGGSSSRIVAFFLLIGVAAVALDAAVNFGLRKITVSKFGAMNKIMSGQVNADILINGSSRALNHYDPRVIESITGQTAYNIGMDASQIDLQLTMLRTYLEHNIKPKVVVQNLDLFSFETTRRGELYDPGYFMPYLRDYELYRFIRRKEPNSWKWKYVPLYGYAVEDMRFTWFWGLLGCFGIQGREDRYQGFNPRSAVWNTDFAHFKAQNAAGVRYRIEPEGVQCFENLVELCAEQGIQIVLVYSPEYYEVQALETNRKDIIGRFHEIADRLKVPFWDYSDSPVSMRRDYFNNSEHLTADGAELFSRYVAQRLAEDFPHLIAKDNRSAMTQPRPFLEK